MANELTRAERLAVALCRNDMPVLVENTSDEDVFAHFVKPGAVALIQTSLDEEREAYVALLKRVVEIEAAEQASDRATYALSHEKAYREYDLDCRRVNNALRRLQADIRKQITSDRS